VRQLHANSVKLARIYQIADGKIEQPNTEFSFLGAIENKWGFASVFYQTDKDEISPMPLGNVEEKVLDQPEGGPRVSLLDSIRHHEKDIKNLKNSQFHTLIINLGGQLSWQGKTLKRLMLCVEYRRKVTNATNRFFAYDEEYPMKNRRGLCVVSHFK
jgi:hypothetical protein